MPAHGRLPRPSDLAARPARGGRSEESRGAVHFDAHPDTHDAIFGTKINHATPFRRAIEEGLVDPKRHIIIGIRGTSRPTDDGLGA